MLTNVDVIPGRANVLGVGVSAVDMRDAIRTIGAWIDRGERNYVCVTGVHGIMESQKSVELRRIHNEAGMVTPDGMPLVWMLKIFGHKDADRVCGPELMPALFAASEPRNDRHYLYGGSEQALDLLQGRLRSLFPRACIVGTCSPPFRALSAEEETRVVDEINACAPDIVWVGLSTPKQEFWMARHRARLAAPVLIGVGAAFDMHAGLVPRAPKFLRRTGLEWTYRLLREPRRLWRRYLSSNPRFVVLAVLQLLGFHRRPI